MSRNFGKGGKSRGNHVARESLPKHARDNRANQLNHTHPAYWAGRVGGMPSHDAPPSSAESGPGSWDRRMQTVDAAQKKHR